MRSFKEINNLDKRNLEPIHIETMFYTKHTKTPSYRGEITCTKTGRKTIQVSLLSDIADFDEDTNYSIVIKYKDGDYLSYIIDNTNITSGIITLIEELKTSEIISFMAMYDGQISQHLSSFGYNGLGQFIHNEMKTVKKVKNILWKLNPSELEGSGSWNNPDILKDESVFLDISHIGGASGGGYCANTDDTLACSMGLSTNHNPKMSSPQRASYSITDGIAGRGISFPINTGVNGYVDICIGVDFGKSYTINSTLTFTRGIAILEMVDGGDNILFRKEISGGMEMVSIPISSAYNTATIKIKLKSDEPTSISMNHIIIWEGSKEQQKVDDMDISIIGDSWTQYPILSDIDYHKPFRKYDNQYAEGFQYLSESIKAVSLKQNNKIIVTNYGRGGQTSEWAKYWYSESVTQNTTNSLVLFFTNDNNSVDEFNSSSTSSYDFSPTNMYSQLNSDIGGLFGAVDRLSWVNNLSYIINESAKKGIQACICMPAHTSSDAQTSSHMDMYGLYLESLI